MEPNIESDPMRVKGNPPLGAVIDTCLHKLPLDENRKVRFLGVYLCPLDVDVKEYLDHSEAHESFVVLDMTVDELEEEVLKEFELHGVVHHVDKTVNRVPLEELGVKQYHIIEIYERAMHKALRQFY
jgi:hypothetical protein